MRTSGDLEGVEPGERELGDVPDELSAASFGMGCFWGVEAKFAGMEGVYRTRVGYTGGEKTDPTYRSLGNHTETCQLLFKPEEIGYEKLLDVFFGNHDYEASRKAQYASRIFFHSSDQRERAEQALKTRDASTKLEELETFWLAENYHQKYRLRQYPDLMSIFSEYSPEQFIESVVAAKLNAAVAGEKVETESFVPEELAKKVEKSVRYR